MPKAIGRTYKGRDVEGLLDLFFYRRVGFLLARIFAKLRVTPTVVTTLSGLVGMTAGHFYFYRDLRLNVIGMLLHVCANALDNADGQLARLTNQGTRFGRMLDGLADHLVFLSVYVHLCLRYISAGGTSWVCLLALAAGISHSLQSAAADYFRNGYLHFVLGKPRVELDSAETIGRAYRGMSWRVRPLRKLLQGLYLNYTLAQERLSPAIRELHLAASAEFRDGVPPSFSEDYRASAKPLTKWLSVLTTNTRMLCLFALLLLGHPVWFFALELTVFNALLFYVVARHEQIASVLRPSTERPAHVLA